MMLDPIEPIEPVDEENHRIAKRMTSELAAKGNPIAGALAALNELAEPFFIPDDDDDLAVDP